MSYLMGIDIGTSSLKTAIMDETGEILAVAAKEYTFDVPFSGYAEQAPSVWWDALALTVRQVLDQGAVDPAAIRGIGFSGQMHGLVPLDKDMRVVRKAILHCDVRSSAQREKIEAAFPEQALSKIVYNPIFPGMLLVSLVWMKENEPENYARTKHVVCPKDYIRYLLTGELGTERTDASGTVAYDMQAQTWADAVFGRLDIPRTMFSDPDHAPYETAGYVTQEAAELTGLRAGTPVVYGGGDQAMQSVGNGLYARGSMMATIGTSGQVMRITDKPVYNPACNTHTFCHVLPGMWFGLGAMLSAGVTLNWFRRNFAPQLSYKQLSGMAEKIAPGSEGLVFFPAMMGERTPYLDAAARGMFVGASFPHGVGHFARAIMEGVAFEMKAGIDILNTLYPAPETIVAAGGASQSSTWVQIQADIYGKTLCVKQAHEQACVGAAIMAGIGSGVYQSVQEGCAAAVHAEPVFIEPIARNAAYYQELYEKVFQRLYTDNRQTMQVLAGLGSPE